MLKCRCAGPHAPPRRQGNPAYSWSHSLRGGAKELNTCTGMLVYCASMPEDALERDACLDCGMYNHIQTQAGEG